ncbi:hypothetical protein Tco_0695225, partial [Tanacetum coccineum]
MPEVGTSKIQMKLVSKKSLLQVLKLQPSSSSPQVPSSLPTPTPPHIPTPTPPHIPTPTPPPIPT